MHYIIFFIITKRDNYGIFRKSEIEKLKRVALGNDENNAFEDTRDILALCCTYSKRIEVVKTFMIILRLITLLIEPMDDCCMFCGFMVESKE